MSAPEERATEADELAPEHTDHKMNTWVEPHGPPFRFVLRAFASLIGYTLVARVARIYWALRRRRGFR